jgi:putative aldouronate transport system permease protein
MVFGKGGIDLSIYKRTFEDKIFNMGNCIIILLLSLTILYPFWHLMILSLSTPQYANTLGLKILPDAMNFTAYKEVLRQDIIATAYFNTILRTLAGTVLTLAVTSAGAYALSNKRMPYRIFFTAMIVFTMFFQGGLIPTYLLVKTLGLINTRWALILPQLVSAFALIIMRNYMSTLPDSLEESARIDGANDIVIFSIIIIPMCIPVIATVTMWTMVMHWNEWFNAMIFTTEKRLMVLQLMLRKVMLQNEANNLFDPETAGITEAREFTDETMKAATLFISIGPIVLTYPFIQKYFIKGIMIGSLKG